MFGTFAKSNVSGTDSMLSSISAPAASNVASGSWPLFGLWAEIRLMPFVLFRFFAFDWPTTTTVSFSVSSTIVALRFAAGTKGISICTPVDSSTSSAVSTASSPAAVEVVIT